MIEDLLSDPHNQSTLISGLYILNTGLFLSSIGYLPSGPASVFEGENGVRYVGDVTHSIRHIDSR